MQKPWDVDQSWAVITAWLGEHCPQSLSSFQGPATEEEIRAVEATVGRPIPADQRAWWRLSNGTGRMSNHLVSVIPLVYSPASTGFVLARHEGLVGLNRHNPDAAPVPQWNAEPAGSPFVGIGVWLPPWVPIAHSGGGDYLFVDLRPGPLYGCVGERHKVQDGFDGPIWPSVTAMLSDVAHGMAHGSEVCGQQATADDGYLHWVDPPGENPW